MTVTTLPAHTHSFVCDGDAAPNSIGECLCPNVQSKNALVCETVNPLVDCPAVASGPCADGEMQIVADAVRLCIDTSAFSGSSTIDVVSANGVADPSSALGTYDAVDFVVSDNFVFSGVMQCSSGACAGNTISWLMNGAASACSASFSFAGPAFLQTRKRQTSGSGPPPTFSVTNTAQANGDPVS